MYEQSGVLATIVVRYLHGRDLDDNELRWMRAYLKQWINATGFFGDEVESLRRSVDSIATNQDLRRWIGRADAAGCDPL